MPSWQDTCNDEIAVAEKEKAISTVLTPERTTAGASVAAFTITAVTKKTQLIGAGLAHEIRQATPIDTAAL